MENSQPTRHPKRVLPQIAQIAQITGENHPEEICVICVICGEHCPFVYFVGKNVCLNIMNMREKGG